MYKAEAPNNEYYLVANKTMEQAEADAKEYEQTRHGGAFAKKIRTARGGLDNLKAQDVSYIRDLILSGRGLWNIIPNLYAVGYERGQKDARKAKA